MTRQEAVARCIERLRPNAKFTVITHSSEHFGDLLGDGFFTAHLYDEQIDANMITTKHGMVVIQNSYIASFAYNVFLCWLHHRRLRSSAESLDRLLAYNFKKFLAEQFYHYKNCIYSRTLLLETLLFQEHRMVHVFAAKDADSTLSADADAGANIMLSALLMHEVSHYFLDAKPELWPDLMRSEDDAITSCAARMQSTCRPAIWPELQCDALALKQCLVDHGQHAGVKFALRAFAFAYAAYAAMYTARATAEVTAWQLNTDPPDSVDFLDIAPMPHAVWRYTLAVDGEFVERARLVLDLCGELASQHAFELFGDDDPFPLPATIVDDLLAYVPRAFAYEVENDRKMSQLVARALHDHPEGMEYLYLRSKTFRTERTEPLTVRPG